jgi:hypothetical protein
VDELDAASEAVIAQGGDGAAGVLDAAEAVEAVPGVGGERAGLLVDAADGAAFVVEVRAARAGACSFGCGRAGWWRGEERVVEADRRWVKRWLCVG